MAARTTKIRHDQETRAKIQTSQLINRLTDHALGEVELSPTQVRAIEVLLRKTLPDLAATAIVSGDQEQFKGIAWLSDQTALSESTIHPANNSSPSTDAANDGLASWPTDGQAKQ